MAKVPYPVNKTGRAKRMPIVRCIMLFINSKASLKQRKT